MAVMESLKEIEVTAQSAQGSLAAEMDAKFKEGYDKGFVDGQASIVLPDPSNPDKLYTQADVDRIVAQTQTDTQGVDQAALDAVTAERDGVKQELLDLQANGAQQVADSIAAFKQVELGKLKALETDFE